MKHRLKKIRALLLQQSLTAGEKAQLEQSLRMYLRQFPATSDVTNSHQLRQQHNGLFSLFITSKPMFIGLIIALIVAASGGTSLAAESALPGDFLYPVKVSINESVRSVVAVSPEAKAEWSVEQTNRRLGEAEQLAVKNRLNDETRTTLQQALERHIKQTTAIAQTLSDRGDNEQAAAIQALLEASLRGHAIVLLGLATTTPSATDDQVAQLVIDVTGKTKTVDDNRFHNEETVTNQSQPAVQAAAQGAMTAAKNKIDEADRFINDHQNQVGAAVTAQATATLGVAENKVTDGQTKLDADLPGEAFVLFKEAHRIAQEAKIIMSGALNVDRSVEFKFNHDDRNGEDDDQPTATTTAQGGLTATSTPAGIRVHADLEKIIQRARSLRTESQLRGEAEADDDRSAIDDSDTNKSEDETENSNERRRDDDGTTTINLNANVNVKIDD